MILFLFGCSEVNSTLLITSELTKQNTQKRTIHFCGIILNAFISKGRLKKTPGGGGGGDSHMEGTRMLVGNFEFNP